jgi:hypothetical protein
MTEFSVATAEAQFAVFPHWRTLARSEAAADGTHHLVVEVEPPQGANVEHSLRIDTAREEVTVSFDYSQSHFNDYIGDGELFGVDAAIAFVKQLVEERVCVVSWWFNEQWQASSELQAGDAPETPSWPSANAINRTRVRSWLGSFTADTPS